jgi:glycosyltransferase involved in cell wall biosynthesis
LKKIAILGPAFPFRGGIAAFNERLAKEFVDSGDNVKVFTFTSQYPAFLFPGKTQYRDDSEPDLDIERVLHSTNPFNWFKAAKSILKFKPDIVIVPFWLPFMAMSMGTVMSVLKRRSEAKIVAIVHNLLPHEKRVGDKVLSKYFFKYVDAAIALSSDVLNKLREFTDIPSEYSPHPIYDTYGDVVDRDEACRNLSVDCSKRYMLFFGLIRKYKGLDMLLQAMTDKRIKDVNLIVAGEFYDDENQYRTYTSENGLNDRVTIMSGYIPDSDIPNLFSVADIVVLPYRSATQSGVTQTAYHFNKPMLVTRVGGLPDLVKDNIAGVHADPTSESITDAIYRFYSQGLSEVISKKIPEEKKRFHWSAFAKVIVEI